MGRTMLLATVLISWSYLGIHSPNAATLKVTSEKCEELRSKASSGNELTEDERNIYFLCLTQVPPKESWPPVITRQEPPSQDLWNPLNPFDFGAWRQV